MKKKNKKIKYNKFKDLLSNQKGVALITVLIFIFLMVTFVVALMAMTSNDIKLSSMQRDSTKAFYQADGGIEKAIWYLNSSQDNPAGLGFMGPLGGGTNAEYYNVDFSYDSGPPEIKTLISTGTLEGGGRYNQDRVVEVKLKKGVSPSPGLNYDYAVLTDDDMDINGGITIHGNIHSNGNIDISNPDVFNLYGSATAFGYNNYPGGSIDVPKKTFPIIDWDFFRELVINSDDPEIENENGNGKYYGSDNSVIWDDPLTLYGVHFVDGDVIVKSDIILQNATIFAAGTIRVLGSGDVYFNNDIKVNPLALIAMGDITIGGGVHGAGIIQTTGGNFTNNGNVDIDEGAIYANVGRFNGGGGKEFNVRYSTDLLSIFVSGTGIPVWVKISWREL
jgi:hypothetical protein